MLRSFPAGILAALLLAGCHAGADDATGALSAQQRLEVTGDVRVFALEVAQDVTLRGPSAWARHFSTAPEFFMASQGKLEFANGADAARGIDELTGSIKRIDLRFGDDLRVDPLTQDYAVIAASFTEVLTDPKDHETRVSGYFTGLAEREHGQWVFRNAHWSLHPEDPTAP